MRIPSKVKISIGGKKFFIVHGNGHGVYYGTSMLEAEAELEECNVAVFGHTHIPFEELHSEIETILITDKLIDSWTYPLIQPKLIEEAQKRGFI